MSETTETGARRLTLVRAGGAPRERGRAIGQALRAEIGGHVRRWRRSLLAASDGDPAGYVRAFLADTHFETAVRDLVPDLMDEVMGLAEGAELPPEDLWALQLLDEEWAYRVRRAAARTPEKCSSLAIVGGDEGPTWIAQNMDLGAYTDGAQAMLHIEAEGDRPGALVFTAAGMIGLLGVNTAGVGVCVNSLPQLENAAHGVPVAFVLRRLLQARDFGEAVDLVMHIPHATNQHYLIAGHGEARSFEACAAGVAEYQAPDPARIFHTNHPLAPEFADRAAPGVWENSEARLAALVDRLARGEAGLVAVEDALCSKDDPRHPICRGDGADGDTTGFTCGSMISALWRYGVQSWASAGPPRERGYSHFPLVGEAD